MELYILTSKTKAELRKKLYDAINFKPNPMSRVKPKKSIVIDGPTLLYAFEDLKTQEDFYRFGC
jgi:hypothetical protein